MTAPKLTAAEVRAEIARRRAKIDKHQAAIIDAKARCSHDETQEERDYQDPRPYRRCLGCGRGIL
jgi:hypothetical protein